MSAANSELSQRVVSRLESRYPYSTEDRDLFFWLWNELKAVAPEASCKATERYIGLYPSQWSRSIFAYVDPQQAGLLIGIFKSVFDKLKPQSYEARHFPDWNPSGKLVGLRIREKNPEIIRILAAARIARVDGLTAVQRLQTTTDLVVDRLLPQVKRDLHFWQVEEERFEGRKRSRHSNYYERDPKLRARAIAIHGTTCMVEACAFNFQAVYGARGRDFIEVHHLKPLSKLDTDELNCTDPAKDMVVVCSNCHRMIHRHRDKVLSLQEVAALIRKYRK